ncbi:hypothetical protein CKF54_04820 [Psittacicella hinzii]|uniref:FAD-binding domain-containing protein n=1 Tax=Psittacicella hinzii TaxID=2028575 RepID=A0A3A1Y5A1_9GAMM|nr:FAD-dependent monooxygenase [Psittacicella hinzii]RIY32388.1 hypothetical protein CKF54_04820 [Psittacicella hinzii]
MLQEAEITVIGSGLVGLSLTIDLIKQGYKVTLIGQPSPELPNPANRVVALNLSSKEFLTALGAWQNLENQGVTPYYSMKVWEKDQAGYLEFKNTDVNQEVLGYNVVNSYLEKALWKTIELLNPQDFTYIESKVSQYQKLQGKHFVSLENGEQVISTFLVAADGGNSFIRKALNIGVNRNEYSQTAITCVLELPEDHNNTCYQSFHKNGILAYLPLSNSKQVSIVWSLNNDIADIALNFDADEFCQQVYTCFHKGLGVPKLISKPTAFPLAKQYAQEIVDDNLAIIGDAAHTIHPLAGQGVNLGFADVWTLADLIREYYRRNLGLDKNKLAQWARSRKTKAVMLSEGMFLIKNLYCNDNKALTFIRNQALSFANKQDFIKTKLINFALGFNEDKYSLASYNHELDLDKQKENSLGVNQELKNTLEQLPNLASKLLNSFFKK